MSNYDNSGALFKNSKKEKETHPDLTGKITVNGVEYNLSGWNNTTKSGDKYLAVKVSELKPKEDDADPFNW
jgi:uncharacterized protein (DUF736 family)